MRTLSYGEEPTKPITQYFGLIGSFLPYFISRSDNDLKVVEWSDEDNCDIGTSPGLFDGGIHGKDESKVFKELCDTVGEAINLMRKEGKPLPPPTANKTFSGKISLRISPDLHKALTLRAFQEGQSINRLIQHKLEETI